MLTSPVPSRAGSPTGGRWLPLLPVAVLVLFAGLSFATARAFAARIELAYSTRFHALGEQIEQSLHDRIETYIQVLRGAQGFWHASARVDREEWARYVQSLALAERYPGIQGLGLSVMVAPGERAAFERAVRAEAPQAPPGTRELFQDFRIQPDGIREQYSATHFLEPFSGRNLRAFGYDMFSEPVRRTAMERARDTGEPALSGRVRLMQETGKDAQPGFVVYLPVYRGEPRGIAQRREQLAGHVYAPFRAHDLMRNTLGYRGLYIQFGVYDGEAVTEDALLFHSDVPEGFTPGQGTHRRTTSLHIAGHRWTVVSEPGPMLISAADRNLPAVLGLAGLAIGVLLAGLSWAWLRTRAQAGHLARAMTADLEKRERELRHVTAQLQRSNENLQQFAYAASHDLKEPLRAISGSLGLLLRRHAGEMDGSAREFIDFATAGAARLSRLIDSLLDFARMSSQAAPLVPVDLDPLLDALLRDLEPLIAETGARIERTPLPRVRGDGVQLRRVLQNLVGNGIKFSRKHGAPQIAISASRDGAAWRISVKDNGIGIPPEHHARIFTMFRRLHTLDEYEGNGMGLALSLRLVERHGGRLWVESAAGAGATFHFTLPDAADGAGPDQPRSVTAP